MEAGAAVVRSLAGMAALSSVGLTNVVGRSAPFQRTTEDARKLLPVTARVKSAPATTTLPGLKLLTTGAGLTIARLAAVEVPPPGPGDTTVIATLAVAATSLARIVALKGFALPNGGG